MADSVTVENIYCAVCRADVEHLHTSQDILQNSDLIESKQKKPLIK